MIFTLIYGNKFDSFVKLIKNQKTPYVFIWINKEILTAANVSLPDGLMRKGKKVAGLEPKS